MILYEPTTNVRYTVDGETEPCVVPGQEVGMRLRRGQVIALTEEEFARLRAVYDPRGQRP